MDLTSSGQQRGRSPLSVLAYLLLMIFSVVCVLAFFVERWLFDTWAALSVDEILYHLSVSLEGADLSTVVKFLREYLPFALLVMLALCLVALFGKKRGGAVQVATTLCVLLVSVGMAGFAVRDASRKVNLSYYLPSIFSGSVDDGEDFIGDNYVDPSTVDLVFPEKKRNLVFLFLESMEMTYADEASGGAFERNVIPELTTLAQDNEDFSGSSESLNGGIVFPGTDWTMGGMFAQTSGTPLKVPVAGGALASYDELFPGMVTLGDILAEEGYHQELVLGTDLRFGGRDAYFGAHGDPDVYDYIWATENGFIPPDYKVFWGFEDEKLFDLLKQRLTALSEEDEPFNVMALTVDTHFEDGYVCRLCDDEFGDNQYANVMACSSRQVCEFVSWLQQQDFYEDTTVVVSGDHITMDWDFCDDVPDSYQRRTYVSVINPSASVADPSRTRSYATFDMFPTTLAALGVEIPGDMLGIGTNLFSEKDTLVEQYGVPELTRSLSRQSKFLDGYSHIEIDDTFMEAVSNLTELRANVLDDGGVRFWCTDSGRLKLEMVKGVKLSVVDSRTNEESTVAMKLKQSNASDPNSFDCYVDTDYTEADLPFLDVEALISVGDFEDYPLAKWDGTVS